MDLDEDTGLFEMAMERFLGRKRASRRMHVVWRTACGHFHDFCVGMQVFF